MPRVHNHTTSTAINHFITAKPNSGAYSTTNMLLHC